jgi:hypothetical protein
MFSFLLSILRLGALQLIKDEESAPFFQPLF